MQVIKASTMRNRLCISASVAALAALSGGISSAGTYTLSSANAPWNVQSDTTSDTIIVGNGTVAELSSSYSSITDGALRIYSTTGWTLNSEAAGSGGASNNISDVIQVEKGGKLYIASGGYTAYNSIFRVYGDAEIKLNRDGTSSFYMTGTNYFYGNLTLAESAKTSIGLSYSQAALYLGEDTNIILNSGSAMTMYLKSTIPAVMGGSLQGSGSLALNTGSLTVNGTNTSAVPWTGTLTLAAGTTFTVGDASHTGAALGNPDNPTGNTLTLTGTTGGYPTLQGYGIVYENVVNNGAMVIAGGTSGSLGTLTVAGDYTQDATGTLKVEVSPTAVSGLHVKGNASLAGTLVVAIDAGAYSTKIYDIVKIDGTKTGAFTNFKTSSAAVGAIAAVLESSTGYQVVTEVVQGANASAPVIGGNLVSANRLGNIFTIDALHDRISNSAPVLSAEIARNTFAWIEAFGRHSSISRSDVGYHTNSAGFITGIEHRIPWHNAVAGLAVSYASESLKAKGNSTADIDNWSISAYGGADMKFIRVDGTAFYNGYGTDVKRDFGSDGVAKSAPYGYAYGGSVQMSKSLYRGLVTPYVRGIYMHQNLAASAETGAGVLNLSYKAINTNTFSADLGVRINPLRGLEDSKTKLLLTVAIEHDFSRLGETVTGTFPVTNGQDWSVYWRGDSENTALFGLDVARHITDNLEVSGHMNGRMSLFQTSGEVALNAKYRF